MAVGRKLKMTNLKAAAAAAAVVFSVDLIALHFGGRIQSIDKKDD